MANATFPEHENGTITLEVEWGGRRFSPAIDPSPQSSPSRIRKLQTRRDEAALPALLGEAIGNRLPWREVSPDETERQSIVEAYIRSLNLLDRFRQDVENMVRYACLANLEFRQAAGETNVTARDAVLSAKLEEMLAQAAGDWRPTKNVLDALLVSQPVSTLRSQLESALADAIAEFARQFFELLAKLVDRQLLGLVEWLPNHCCGYHFFKRVIIQENEGASRRTLDTRLDESAEPDSVGEGRIVGYRTTEVVLGRGKHHHRFARHEHSVMNAVRTTIRNSRVVVPPQAARLLEQVPDWLYPFVQVIDGDIFRERIIEKDIRVEDWADVQVRDEPIFGWEPAVIIGPYVLTGWGPREVGEEQSRRQATQNTAARVLVEGAALRRAPMMVATAIVLTLVSLLLLIQTLRGGGGAMFVVLATAAAIGSVWQAAFDYATARRNPTAALAAHCLTATVGFQLLLAEWLVARWFQPMSWVTPVALALGALVCRAAACRFRSLASSVVSGP